MLGLEIGRKLTEEKAIAPEAIAEQWRAVVDDCVISLGWSSDGQHIAAASISGSVYVFNAETGSLEMSLAGHEFGATVLAWRPKGTQLASAGQDGKIRIWNSDSGELLRELDGGSRWVEHLAWSPSGAVLVSAAGRKLKVWSPEGELVHEYPDHPNTIAAIAWRPRTDEFASACYGQIQIWRHGEDKPIRTFSWKGSMLALAWSPDGRYLCHGNQDSTVHFWMVKKRKELQMWGYPTKIRELAWDRHSRYLATGGGSQVTIWNCSRNGPADTKPIVHKYHEQLLTQLAYQRGGPLLASGCTGGRVAIWGPGRQKGPQFRGALPSAITQLAWSPSDRHLAAACEDGALAVLPLGGSAAISTEQNQRASRSGA